MQVLERTALMTRRTGQGRSSDVSYLDRTSAAARRHRAEAARWPERTNLPLTRAP